jgi:hypothetical protein
VGALLGLVTFCCFGGFFLGIFAIVKGNEAKRVLDHYGVDEGRSMAVAAMVLGALDVGVSLVFVLVNVLSGLGR